MSLCTLKYVVTAQYPLCKSKMNIVLNLRIYFWKIHFLDIWKAVSYSTNVIYNTEVLKLNMVRV